MLLKWKIITDFLLWLAVTRQGQADKCAGDTFQSEIAAKTQCLEDCWFGNLQTHFPTLYNRTGWRRDPPRDPKASAFCAVDHSGVNQSGVSILWGLPHSYGAAGIEGYELRIEDDPTDYRCHIIVLDEKVTQHNKQSMFNITLYPVSRSNHFKIVFHSLPRANDSIVVSLDVVTSKCERGDSSSNWSPAHWNESYNVHEKVLTVWFSAPPTEINITEYNLWLIPLPMDIKRYQHILANSTEVRFADVSQGKYKLVMQPYDRHTHDEGLCVCRDDTGRCEGCKQSVWSIEISPPGQMKVDVSVSRTTVIVGIAGGTLLFLMLLLILYKVLAKRFGISVDVGQCTKGKNHFFILVDAGLDKRNSSRLLELLKESKHFQNSVRQDKIMYDERLAENLQKFQRKYSLSGIQKDRGKGLCCKIFKFNEVERITICLLVDRSSVESFPLIIEKIRNCLSSVEFISRYLTVCFQCSGAFFPENGISVYNFESDAQKIQKFVQDVFTGNDNGQITYTVGGDPSQQTKSTMDKLGSYVALPCTTLDKIERSNCRVLDDISSENTNTCYNTDVDGVIVRTTPPLISPKQRNRFVSDDSGNGGSESSFQQRNCCDVIPDCDDTHYIRPVDSEFCGLMQFKYADNVTTDKLKIPLMKTPNDKLLKRSNGCEASIPMEKEPCPSCDISFYPPSIISESDFLSNDLHLDESDDIHGAHRNAVIPSIMCQNCSEQLKRPFGNSLELLTEEMIKINERNIARNRANKAEVYSILEGHV